MTHVSSRFDLWLLICGSGAFSSRKHIDKEPVRPAAWHPLMGVFITSVNGARKYLSSTTSAGEKKA